MEEKVFRYKTLDKITPYITGDNGKVEYKTFNNLKLYFMDLNINDNTSQEEHPSRHKYTIQFLLKNNNIQMLSIVLNDIIMENGTLIEELTEILNNDTQGNFQYILHKDSDGRYSLVKTDKKNIPKWTFSTPSNNEELVYIDFDEYSRDITLNGIVWLSQPNYSSENYLVFKYLYDNPNKKVSREEILENAMNGENLKKKTHEILRDLGFTGNLREIFFTTSKENTIFHKERNRSEIEKLLPIKFEKEKKE